MSLHSELAEQFQLAAIRSLRAVEGQSGGTQIVCGEFTAPNLGGEARRHGVERLESVGGHHFWRCRCGWHFASDRLVDAPKVCGAEAAALEVDREWSRSARDMREFQQRKASR